MAGPQDTESKAHFLAVAEHLADNGHNVFVLSNQLQPIFKAKLHSRVFLYGIGTQHQFDWDSALSDDENQRLLDVRAARAYFGHDPMLYEMRKQNFDLGIGGLARSDGYLFRYLSIPYIRIIVEDVDEHIMHYWLDIPTFPPVRTDHISNTFDDLTQFLKSSWDKYWHVQELRTVLGKSKSQIAIDAYDQDHSLILGLGVPGGLF